MDKATKETMSKADLKIWETYQFVKRTDEKALRKKIEEFVKLAKDVRKQELSQKRERLRALFAKEEEEFEDEYIRIVQTKVHDDVKERQNRLIQIQKEQDQESREFVHLKKVQQYMNNCDDIRLQLRKNVLNDTKLCQLIQIEEKQRNKLQEIEHNRVWEDIAKNLADEQQRMDDCKQLRKKEEILRNRQILRQQINEIKEVRELERKEEMEARQREEEIYKRQMEMERLALAGEAGKRLEQAKLLKAQQLEAMELNKKRIADEIAFDRLFQEACNAQYEREQREMAAKVNRLRETTITYLNYLKELKKERQRDQTELDKILREFQVKANEKRDKQQKENKEKKIIAAKEAHQELLKQICESEQRRLEEKEKDCLQAEKDRERWECEYRKDKEKEKARERFALNYGVELLSQIKEIKCYEAAQKKIFEEELNRAENDEKFCELLLTKFMNSEVDYLRAHPNWKLMTCSCLNNK